MPLSFQDQFDLATGAIVRGDVDLMEKLLTRPDEVTPSENRSMAEWLGMKRGFLSAVVNIVTDPTTWVALWLSRKMPVTSWIKGEIPSRFIGSSAEFTGVSLVTRPIEGFFRGTNIPRLLALKMKREGEVMRIAQDKIIAPMLETGFNDSMPMVSLLLEGQNPAGATTRHRDWANRIRSGMDDMWKFLAKAQRIEGGFGAEVTFAKGAPYDSSIPPRYLRDYLPHIPIFSKESMMTIDPMEAMGKLRRTPIEQATNMKGMSAADVWTPTAVKNLESNFSRFQAWLSSGGMQLNPRLFQRTRQNVPLESDMGRELFVTDLNVILPQYVRSVARTYANATPLTARERFLTTNHIRDDATGERKSLIPTDEPILVQIINQGIAASNPKMVRRYVAGTNYAMQHIDRDSMNHPMMSALKRLVQSVEGRASEDEILFGNLFSTIGRKLDLAKRSSGIGNHQVAEIDASIRAFERNQNYRSISNGIASYFYATTLGLNPFSAIQNLMQPALTTMPAIGIGSTLAGYKVLGARIPQYVNKVLEINRSSQLAGAGPMTRFNEAMELAFRDTFPELANNSNFRIDPRAFEIDESHLLAGGRFSKFFRGVDNFNKVILQPFTRAEMSNQIVSFYGGKHALRKMMRTGEYTMPNVPMTTEMVDDLLNFEAGLVVNESQFRPGPGTRTYLQTMLPAPFRQFTSFPVRLANYFTQSTIRGAMTQKQLETTSIMDFFSGGALGELAQKKVATFGTGRNLGVLARSFLYGRVMVEGASQVLDVDISNSLGVLAPFNFAPEGQPFAPMPLPPIVGTAFGLISAASTRDIKEMQPLVLPNGTELPIPKTLIPGGLAATRLSRAIQQFRPDLGGFVDENERLMYRGDTSDFIMAALGVPRDKDRRTRNTVERIQSNRMMMRKLRRDYAQAHANYDTSGMRRTEARWAKAFPDMPPITVSDSDVMRYRQMQRIPMVNRMIQGMGDRGKYLEAQIYAIDPDIVATPEMLAQAQQQ